MRHPESEPSKAIPSAGVAAPPAKPVRCLVPLASAPPEADGPAPSCPADPTGPPTLPHGWVSFPDAPSVPRIAIEIAETDSSRERGLMYRTKMPEDQGMIFNWSDESERAFWMHDTCIPLDMLYVAADGVIVGVLEQVPAMDESAREIPCPVAHVLEVNAGWTRAHGIAPGQRIHIET